MDDLYFMKSATRYIGFYIRHIDEILKKSLEMCDQKRVLDNLCEGNCPAKLDNKLDKSS